MKGSLSVLLALLAIEALAQSQLEVLPLRSRTAEELIPILRPLVEPGGVLTGQGYQLIVRASPRNLEEIRSAIASLDRPPRRLVIAVRQVASAAQQASDVEARVRIGPDPAATVRIGETTTKLRESVEQRVQVLEGARAWVAIGESRPIVERRTVLTPAGRVIQQETTTLEQANTGFEVLARVSGDTVTLEIFPRREALAAGGGVRRERVATVVSGRLGQWIEVGGVALSSSAGAGDVVSTREARAAGSVWIRVDEAP